MVTVMGEGDGRRGRVAVTVMGEGDERGWRAARTGGGGTRAAAGMCSGF